ncbi:MAG: MarR family transcriptional regulator [bacterium]|nr:MarR family transcriptional regulator [Candidatus Kapabacteria bacterium]
MESKLRKEIRQTKPFVCMEEEAHLNIARTAAAIEHRFGEVFKEFGITPTQYNALRILRGAGEKGLFRNEIRDRLIAQVPDATRLLDRLAELSLVSRIRDEGDRRHVNTRITKRGLQMLDDLEKPVIDGHRNHFKGMSRAEMQTLIDLMERIRETCIKACASGNESGVGS